MDFVLLIICATIQFYRRQVKLSVHEGGKIAKISFGK
jgi:hypothetical protein